MTAPAPDDLAAPLDALLVDAALGPLRRFAPDASTLKLAARLAGRPRGTAARLGTLAAELFRVALGTSAVAPDNGDRRFTDPAWTSNPLLHRAVQAYLATGRTATDLVDHAGLDWRDRERVRFGVENLVAALAPSNVPMLNPASAKAVVDTGGLNLLRGALNLAADMRSAPRVPRMVDPSAFTASVGSTSTQVPCADRVNRDRTLSRSVCDPSGFTKSCAFADRADRSST